MYNSFRDGQLREPSKPHNFFQNFFDLPGVTTFVCANCSVAEICITILIEEKAMSALVCIGFFALAGAQEPLNLGRLYLFDNNPFAPFIQTFPTLKAGQLVLKLRNDFHKPVMVKGVFIGEGDSLLQEQKELVPAETMMLDITEELRGLFTAEPQEQIVRISLSVEPLPEAQPEPSEYRVRFENGQFTEFTKIERPQLP